MSYYLLTGRAKFYIFEKQNHLGQMSECRENVADVFGTLEYTRINIKKVEYILFYNPEWIIKSMGE